METAESSVNHPILSLPLIDLRLLSQPELHSLSLSSATNGGTNHHFDIPKIQIDRSIFNESAGSRKQTYSRLRLLPRNKSNSRRSPSSSSSSFRIPPEPENSDVVSFLKGLFGVVPLRGANNVNPHDPLRVLALPPPPVAGTLHNVPVDVVGGSGLNVPVAVVDGSSSQTKSRKRGRPRKNQEAVVSVPVGNGVAQEEAKAMAMVVAVVEDEQKNGFVVEDEQKNGSGQNVPVDVVDGSSQKQSRKRGRPRKNQEAVVPVPVENGGAAEEEAAKAKAMVVPAVEDEQKNGLVVEDVGDPFVEQLIERTQGLVTESQMREFMESLEGVWASDRKKRRIVDARILCDLLPPGWKLVLILQRRAGRFSVLCRFYKSPDGHQFESYKDVCTHLSSNNGNFAMASENHQHVGHVPTSMETDANAISAYHEKQTSIASSIGTEKQASIASSIGTEKLNIYDGNSNSHLALGHKLGDAGRDSDQTEDKQPLKADKNDANSVQGCSLKQDNEPHENSVDAIQASDAAVNLYIPLVFTSPLSNNDIGIDQLSDERNAVTRTNSGIYNFDGQDRNTVSYETVPCGKDQAHFDNCSTVMTQTSMLKDSAVGSLFDNYFPSGGVPDASGSGGVDFIPDLKVGKDVNDNHVYPNEEVVTSYLQKRSSSDDQMFTMDNLLGGSFEGNLFPLANNQHPSAFQDNMNITAGTFDVLKSVDAGCVEPQLGIISSSNVVAADACTSARVMQGTSEGCVSVPLGGSMSNCFDKQCDDDVNKVKKSCLSEKAKSEVEMFQNDSMGMSKFQ